MKASEFAKSCMSFFNRYKYVLLVAAAGLLFLVWSPGEKNAATNTAQPATQAADYDLSEVERKIEELLSKAEGVGRIEVVLALKTGTEYVYADETNEEESKSMESGALADSGMSAESRVVIVSDGDGNESPVVVKRIYPEYLGALVVCDGADSASVRLKITSAISALTGIGADSITIVKMGK